jgi:hypothetical protein
MLHCFLGERYKCNEENFCSSEIGLILNAWKDLLENASLANTKKICDNAIVAYCAQPSPKIIFILCTIPMK